MLTKLTPEQEALMTEVRNEWINRCDTYSPIDRDAVKSGIDWMYEISGLKPPMIIYLSSPMALQYAANMLRSGFNDQVGDQVWDQVGGQVWDQVGAQVRDQVGAQVRDQVGAQVLAQVLDQVWDQVGDQVGAQVLDQVWDQVRDQVWAQVKLKYFAFAGFGSLSDFGWVSFYDFFRRIGVHQHQGFFKFQSLLKAGVYDMIQLKGICLVAEKPQLISRNEEGRLHSTTGYAIRWQDSYGLHFINGRPMPSWIFEKVSKQHFLSEENEDVKAGIYEIIEANGEGSMLAFLAAETIDTTTIVHANGDLEELVLYKTKELFEGETDLNGKSPAPLAWLKLTCPSTGSTYLIPSDGSFKTALEAAKWHRPEQVPASLEYSWNSRS